MPFLKEIIINEDTKIKLWKVTLGEINPKELNKYDKILFRLRKNNTLKEQFLAIRKMIAIENSDYIISYDQYGKPSLNSEFNISISHSDQIVALLLSKKKNIGIDVQQVKDKIYNVQKKFLNKKELQNNDKIKDLDLLTKIWTSKEAIYKSINMKNVSFSKNLFIDTKNEKSNKCFGYFFKKNIKMKFMINYFNLENYILTYVFRIN